MKPSWLARALVGLLADDDDRAFVVADLDERFAEVARERGLRAARRWYWAQALSAVPSALLPDFWLIRRRSWTGLPGDLRLGLRAWRRRPFYALGVAGTLGLGLAVAIVTFAVAWHVWLAPLPIPDPERVVRLYEIAPVDPAEGDAAAGPDSRRHLFSDQLAVDFHEHEWRTVESVAFVMGRSGTSAFALDGETHHLTGVSLPDEGFEILGIVPSLGRLPSTVERELLVGETFWRTALGEDPDVVGKTLTHASGWAMEIVGVARFPSGYPGDIQTAWFFDWRVQGGRTFRWYEVIARLRPDFTIAEAEAEMSAFVAALAVDHQEHRGWSVEAVPLKEDLVRPFRPVIALLLAAGVAFLVLAAVNVLGLVAARRVEGRGDRGVRLALGATEARLLRASLIESGTLAALGAAAGVVGARLTLPGIRSMGPADVPRLADAAVTWGMAASGLAAGLVVACGTGLVGYLASRTKGGVTTHLRRRTGRAGGRRLMVVGQVALTTLLVAGGVSILNRVLALKATDLGFEAGDVLTTSADLATVPRYDRSAQELHNALDMILTGLGERGLAAAVAFNTPMSPAYSQNGLFPMSIRPDPASDEVFYELQPVLGDYFRLMGIELIAGRPFASTDDDASENVAIVSEDFARLYFRDLPIARVLGQPIDSVTLLRDPATVVGVTRATRHHGPETPPTPSIYIPFAQQRTVSLAALLVDGSTEVVAPTVSAVLAAATPDVEWSPLVPYASYLSAWFAPFRFQLTVVGALAGLGLLLASLGLYSLMAYQVAIDRRELGIRKALGARNGRLLVRVVARGLAMAAAGVVIGLAVWYRLLSAAGDLLVGGEASSPRVPILVTLLVGAACALATLAPAVRATRVDVAVTLKAD